MKYPVSFKEMNVVENDLCENPTYMEIKKQLRIQRDILKGLSQKYPNASYEEYSDEDKKIYVKAKKEETRLNSKKSALEKNEHERREGIREKYGMLGLQDGNELKGRLDDFVSDMIFMQARSPEAQKEARGIISLVMPNVKFDEFSDTWIKAKLNGIVDKVCAEADVKTVTFESLVAKINEELRKKENEKKASKEDELDVEPAAKVAEEKSPKTDTEVINRKDEIRDDIGNSINISDVMPGKYDNNLNEKSSKVLFEKENKNPYEKIQTEVQSNSQLVSNELTWMNRFKNWHKTMLDKLPQKVQHALKTISEAVRGRNRQNEVEQNEVRKNDDGER